MDLPVTFGDFIQPICLPEGSTNVYNALGTTVGYGLSEESEGNHEKRPKHVEIKSVEQAVCLFKEHAFVQISSLRMFCAGEMGKNPCKGELEMK